MARTVGTLSGTLGIDFGTSNSAVSWAPPGQTARLLALEGESTTLPTAIFFDDEEHSTHFGREAMARYLAHHEGRLMRSLKSLLGSALLREQTVVHGKPQSYQDIVSGFLQELVRRAVEESKSRDEVLDLLQELAARHGQERQALTKQVDEL